VAERDLYIVTVTDLLTPALVGHAGCHYESPPQDEQQARTLIRVLLGAPRTPGGAGPWQYSMAGGRRYVTLHRNPQ
jgi:hypothetical protein